MFELSPSAFCPLLLTPVQDSHHHLLTHHVAPNNTLLFVLPVTVPLFHVLNNHVSNRCSVTSVAK